MEEADNKIVLVDELGNEKEYEVMLTFASDETQKKYVYYYDASSENENDELEVYVSVFDDDNNIFPIEDEQELAMVEEVYNAFIEEQGLGIDE